jgi:putative FmdB family regulatory protein
MPIYEYQCQSCGHQFEIMQKVSDPVMQKCPDCGKRKLKKLVSAVAFRLKGGGWYETDFKKGDKKKNLLSDSGDASTKSSSDGADKADKKSADDKKSDGASSEKASKDKTKGSKAKKDS